MSHFEALSFFGQGCEEGQTVEGKVWPRFKDQETHSDDGVIWHHSPVPASGMHSVYGPGGALGRNEQEEVFQKKGQSSLRKDNLIHL